MEVHTIYINIKTLYKILKVLNIYLFKNKASVMYDVNRIKA